MLGEHANCRADLTRRAIAALEAVVVDERGLHRMQIVTVRQALDRRDRVAVVHHGERQAGVDPAAVDQHGAGAALSVVAALFRAGSARCSRKASSRVVRESNVRSWSLPLMAMRTGIIDTPGSVGSIGLAFAGYLVGKAGADIAEHSKGGAGFQRRATGEPARSFFRFAHRDSFREDKAMFFHRMTGQRRLE